MSWLIHIWAGALLFFGIYRLYFTPLAKIPGPPITALTQLWLMYHEFKGDRTVQIDRLHAKYGPVVRVSPSEVSFNSSTAVKEIYGVQSTFSKSDFYDMFVYYGQRNTFTSLTKTAHSASKRTVANRYTKSYVMQPAVAEKVRGHAARLMEMIAQKSVLDVYWALHYYALDSITTHVYGAYGTSSLTNTTDRELVYDLSGVKHRTRLYLIFYFSAILTTLEAAKNLVRRLRGLPGDFHVRGARLDRYGRDSVAGFRQTELGRDTVSTCAQLLSKKETTHTSNSNSHTSDSCTAAECMDHLVAGVDTTGDAMCIALYLLSLPSHFHIQEKLFTELLTIDAHFDPHTQTAPISVLDNLPYLDAVITEAMRWRPPVPMTLFRVVPSAGKMLDGYWIPGGITVGCQAYSLHRMQEVFPDPDRFDPERWLTEDKERLAAMRAVYWPFSSGGRMCLGHNFAMVEMKTILASVYRFYRTTVTPQCTDKCMEMDDQLTSGVPYGLSCLLVFEKRSD